MVEYMDVPERIQKLPNFLGRKTLYWRKFVPAEGTPMAKGMPMAQLMPVVFSSASGGYFCEFFRPMSDLAALFDSSDQKPNGRTK
jgi:hypothetical protein